MEPIVIAVLCSMAVYCVIIAAIPKRYMAQQTYYTRGMLKKLEQQQAERFQPTEDAESVLREQMQKSNVFTRIFFTLPGAMQAYPKLLKAGLQFSIDKFFLSCVLVMLVALLLLKNLGLWSLPGAIFIAYLFGRWTINRRIRKRSELFLRLFPDALDMIVRSVRSGYPFNAAVKMVAENMEAPVSTEFKQVYDEAAYGSNIIDALKRLAERIDEPDIHFFVVVLSVQQEVGGNLAEVLSNLSQIIRKRKHLRLKIKALSSEGRATGWVLGALPLFVITIINYMAPQHLEPLFHTSTGNMILTGTVCLIGFGIYVIRQMVNMEI